METGTSGRVRAVMARSAGENGRGGDRGWADGGVIYYFAAGRSGGTKIVDLFGFCGGIFSGV